MINCENKEIVDFLEDNNTNTIFIDESNDISELENNEKEENIINGEIINYGDIPTDKDWKLNTLYSESATGGLLMWEIGYNDKENKLMIKYGKVEGKKTYYETKIEKNKSNRNLQEQALIEAKSRYTEKYNQGYRTNMDPLPHKFKPMKANEYWKGGYNEKEKKIKKSNISKFPVAVMVKIDGYRGLSYKKDNNEIEILSQNNKSYIFTPNHLLGIRNELKIFFMYLPQNIILDGELYNHDINFNTIQTAITTRKLGAHDKNKCIKYYIFDIIENNNLPFEDRYEILSLAYNKFKNDNTNCEYLNLVNVEYAHSHDDIDKLHNSYINNGYEGAMIRKLSGDKKERTKKSIEESVYKFTRSNNLLKVKHFIDKEGFIVGVKDGSGSDTGLAIFMVKDEFDNIFPVRPRGTEIERKEWFDNKNDYIGKSYTYRFFEYTTDNKPRFPTGKGFRKDLVDI